MTAPLITMADSKNPALGRKTAKIRDISLTEGGASGKMGKYVLEGARFL